MKLCKNLHPEAIADEKRKIENNKIEVVIVKFTTGSPDLYFRKEEWISVGKYKGFLKQFAMSILDINSVTHKEIREKEFPTTEWDG